MPDERAIKLRWLIMQALVTHPGYFKKLYENGLLTSILNIKLKRNSKPPKRTAEEIAQADEVCKHHQKEIWAARKLRKHYTDNGLSDSAAKKKVAEAHPEMPHQIFAELFVTEPKQVALEWTIQDLGLDITVSRLKVILNSKADTNRLESR